MSQYKKLIEQFKGRRPLLNIVLDGYGLGREDHTNAIFRADTPFMDYLRENFANTTLLTHGKFVGLPYENDLGGSEVGHLTIGAGRITSQKPTLIAKLIKDGSFFQRPMTQRILKEAQTGALHLIGLLSDGNVHSHIDHFIAIIEEAARQGVKKCYVHGLLDGRDVGFQSADIYIKQMEKVFAQILDSSPDREYGFASLGGREVITMDRDKVWEKVEAGWKTHVQGESGNYFNDPLEAVKHFRKQRPDMVDQDCPPFNIVNDKGQVPTIKDGDVVVNMNFRADRALELTRAFTEDNFREFDIPRRPKVFFASMMVYDEDRNIPENTLVEVPAVNDPFGKRILDLGLNQFRLAETQKYAHVTFFFNGGYHDPLDPEKEIYCLIDSDKVDSFAMAPKMKAFEIADKAVDLIRSGKFDYGLINFANTDMVGHTGDMKAAMTAAETVDMALRTICEEIKKADGVAIVTADHGNADEMIIVNPDTQKEEICAKHSINPVPFIIYDHRYQGDYSLKQPRPGAELDLSMIAAANFILLGYPAPDDINDSLFEI